MKKFSTFLSMVVFAAITSGCAETFLAASNILIESTVVDVYGFNVQEAYQITALSDYRGEVVLRDTRGKTQFFPQAIARIIVPLSVCSSSTGYSVTLIARGAKGGYAKRRFSCRPNNGYRRIQEWDIRLR